MHRIFCKNFLKDNTASAAIEFALVLPIFLVLVLGIIELGLMSFGNSVISNTMLHATRQAMIGSYGSGDTKITEASLKAQIRRASAGLVNFDAGNVKNKNGSIKAYVISSATMDDNRFTGTPIGDAVNSILAGGNVSDSGLDSAITTTGSVVIYEVRYTWPRFFRYLSNIGVFSSVTNYRSYSVVPHMG